MHRDPRCSIKHTDSSMYRLHAYLYSYLSPLPQDTPIGWNRKVTDSLCALALVSDCSRESGTMLHGDEVPKLIESYCIHLSQQQRRSKWYLYERASSPRKGSLELCRFNSPTVR